MCLFPLQLESIRNRLDEKNSVLKEKEKKMQNISSQQSESSYEVENLKGIIDSKERHITNLKERVSGTALKFALLANMSWSKLVSENRIV